MIYFRSKKKFWKNWKQFSQQYQINVFHADYVKYLLFIYIINYRQRFVRCYINKVLHFGTTTTSRSESEHAVVKRQFESFIDDLKIIVNDFILMLMNEYQNHLIKINEARIRLFMNFRKSIFQHIIAHVISVVLRKIMSQYELLIDQSTVFLFCIESFSTSMKLSCSHKIQKRLFDENDILLNDVHFHWKWKIFIWHLIQLTKEI